jgi:hypothetical protein
VRRLPPQEGCRPLVDPLRARYAGLGNFRDNREVRTHAAAEIGLRWRTVYTKYLTLPEGLQAPKLITRHYYTGTRAPRPAAWRKSEVVSANHFLYRLDGIPFQTIVHMNVGFDVAFLRRYYQIP